MQGNVAQPCAPGRGIASSTLTTFVWTIPLAADRAVHQAWNGGSIWVAEASGYQRRQSRDDDLVTILARAEDRAVKEFDPAYEALRMTFGRQQTAFPFPAARTAPGPGITCCWQPATSRPRSRYSRHACLLPRAGENLERGGILEVWVPGGC
jgi:hypothetical protein